MTAVRYSRGFRFLPARSNGHTCHMNAGTSLPEKDPPPKTRGAESVMDQTVDHMKHSGGTQLLA